MVKKKIDEEIPEEIPEEVLEEGEPIDLAEEPKELTQEEKIEVFFKSLDIWKQKLEKAVMGNQNIIKGLWERVKVLENNFKIHIEQS